MREENKDERKKHFYSTTHFRFVRMSDECIDMPDAFYDVVSRKRKRMEEDVAKKMQIFEDDLTSEFGTLCVAYGDERKKSRPEDATCLRFQLAFAVTEDAISLLKTYVDDDNLVISKKFRRAEGNTTIIIRRKL